MKESIQCRHYAHPLDRPVDGPNNEHQVDKSPDAIGGAYGIGWTEYFIDRNTGQLYNVHCSDGVNGGKGAYPDHIEKWRGDCYNSIRKRTRLQAVSGSNKVPLSKEEWIVMMSFCAHQWLDPLPGQEYATKDNSITEGQIGTIAGVPVIVDLKAKSRLPEVPELENAPK